MFFSTIYILFHFSYYSYISGHLFGIESMDDDEQDFSSKSNFELLAAEVVKKTYGEQANSLTILAEHTSETVGNNLCTENMYTITNRSLSPYNVELRHSFNGIKSLRKSHGSIEQSQNVFSLSKDTQTFNQTQEYESNTAFNSINPDKITTSYKEDQTTKNAYFAHLTHIPTNSGVFSSHMGILMDPNPQKTDETQHIYHENKKPIVENCMSKPPNQSNFIFDSRNYIVLFIAYRENSDGTVSNHVLDVMKIYYSQRSLEKVSIFPIPEYFELFTTHQITLNDHSRFSICPNAIHSLKEEGCHDFSSTSTDISFENTNFYLYIDSNEDFFALKIDELHNRPVYQNYLVPLEKVYLLFEYKQSSHGFLLFSCIPISSISSEIKMKMENNVIINYISDINNDLSHNTLDMNIGNRIYKFNNPPRKPKMHSPNRFWSENSLFHLPNEFNIAKENFSDLSEFLRSFYFGEIPPEICKNESKALEFQKHHVKINLQFRINEIYFFTSCFDEDLGFVNRPRFRAEVHSASKQIWVEKSSSHLLKSELCLYSTLSMLGNNELLFPLHMKTTFSHMPAFNLNARQNDRGITHANGIGNLLLLFTIRQSEKTYYLVLSHPVYCIHLLKTCFIANNHDNELFLDYKKGDLGELWFSFTKHDPNYPYIQQKMADRKYIIEFTGDHGELHKDLIIATYFYEKYKYFSRNDNILLPLVSTSENPPVPTEIEYDGGLWPA